MIKPSWSFADVFALNALQKSMMLTPCWPSAGPTGGAGVALPAGMCSFTYPGIFFAMASSRLLQLLDLQEVELPGRGPSEDGDHHLPGRPGAVCLVHAALA